MDTNADAKVLKTYYDKYEEYVIPNANPFFARYKFQEKLQGVSESAKHVVTEVKFLVEDCN